MTTINSAHGDHTPITLTIANFLESAAMRIRAGYVWRRSYNRTHRELAGLDDRELHDLGMSRADISRISAEAAQVAMNREAGAARA